jgi:DNA-binding transcriptional LysR family regulator
VADRGLELVPVTVDVQLDAVRAGEASMALVRLPVAREGLHLIPLYEEVPVVVASREHVVAAFEEVEVEDLADEVLVQGPDAVPEWAAVASRDAKDRSATMPPMTDAEVVEVVAAGGGIAILPLSIARLHHRQDVVHRPVHGVAGSRIGLAWRVDDPDPGVEVFIGIVRGRTENSSRGTTPSPDGGGRTATSGSSGSSGSSGTSDRRRSPGRSLPQRGAAPRRGGTRSRRRGR